MAFEHLPSFRLKNESFLCHILEIMDADYFLLNNDNNIYLFNVEYKQTVIKKQKNFYIANKIRPYPRRHIGLTEKSFNLTRALHLKLH